MSIVAPWDTVPAAALGKQADQCHRKRDSCAGAILGHRPRGQVHVHIPLPHTATAVSDAEL